MKDTAPTARWRRAAHGCFCTVRRRCSSQASRRPCRTIASCLRCPEGQYTDAKRTALVKDVTDAVVRADGGKFEDVSPRVWVFPTEIPDGQWGGRGRIVRLPEIHTSFSGDEREVGVERLKRHRRVKALELLEGALDAARKGTD